MLTFNVLTMDVLLLIVDVQIFVNLFTIWASVHVICVWVCSANITIATVKKQQQQQENIGFRH